MYELKRYGISLKEVDDDVVVIRQTYPIGGNILTSKQLHTIARRYYPKHKIKPVTFRLEAPSITIDWIKNEMETLGLSRKDLHNQLDIDNTTISLVLNEKREIPKMMAIACYYYFLSMRLNRELRGEIDRLTTKVSQQSEKLNEQIDVQ